MKRAVLLLTVIAFMANGATAQARMNTTTDHIELNLGQEVGSSLVVHNPLDRPDIYDIGVGTVMEDGSASVQIVGDEKTSDRVRVEVGAGETRSVSVFYTGGSCPSEACTGSATFVGRSLETNRRFTATTQITVRRDTHVYGSPGITVVQAVVLGLLGSLLSLLWS
ncbi:MAG: hypothetical protein SVW02_00560 [Candidatus Nanohaloarchaea archaeon]|nr:hypothetical protein [Candidatus Nanohaloarchaea archaeon]